MRIRCRSDEDSVSSDKDWVSSDEDSVPRDEDSVSSAQNSVSGIAPSPAPFGGGGAGSVLATVPSDPRERSSTRAAERRASPEGVAAKLTTCASPEETRLGLPKRSCHLSL